MPEAAVPFTTSTYRLGHHPRRTDHPALLDAAGTAVATFALGATRTEILASLAISGFTLHDDDTVTPTPARPAASRREVITHMAAGIMGAAVISSTPAAAASSNDRDAELIEACERFMRLDEQHKAGDSQVWMHSTPGGPPTPEEIASEERFNAISDEQHEIGQRIADMPARTLAGMRAKARAIAAYNVGDLSPEAMIDRLTVSLVNDVVGEA